MSDRAELLSIHGQVPPKAAEAHSRLALAHLFWWFMFAQGGVIAAILLPVHILFQGILGPLGLVRVASLHDSHIIGNPIEPVIKLTANAATAATMSEHIDLDVSGLLTREIGLAVWSR